MVPLGALLTLFEES